MPAKTQDTRKLLTISKNLYEATILIARRARQINDELYQKKRDRQILEELEGGFDEDFLNTDSEEKELKVNLDEEENPIVYAHSEFDRSLLGAIYESRRNRP